MRKKHFSWIKEFLNENEYVNRYWQDDVFKSNVGLVCSVFINLLYILINAVSAAVYQMAWFGIFAVYYMIIATMRLILVRSIAKYPIGTNIYKELRTARICSYILLTVNLTLSGTIHMMLLFGMTFQYQGYLIYAIAAYTFYSVTMAVINLIKYRKYKSPVISITKIIKLTSSLFSMLFLETAMFAQFGKRMNSESERMLVMATGAIICIIVVSMSLYMIIQTKKTNA